MSTAENCAWCHHPMDSKPSFDCRNARHVGPSAENDPGYVPDEDALLEALKAAPHIEHTAEKDAPCRRCGEPRRCHGKHNDECVWDEHNDVPVPLDPIDPTLIGPGLAAIPLAPTPWDDAEDGQYAVTPDGTMWQRRKGLWHMVPWWQGTPADEIVAICANPDDWAYGLGWTRKHVEDAKGPLTYVIPPGTGDTDG